MNLPSFSLPSSRAALALVFAGAPLVLGACHHHHRHLEPLQLQARVAQVVSGDANSVTLHVEFYAYNPNAVPLYSRNIAADFSVQGQLLGRANVVATYAFPPNTPLPVSVNIAVPRTTVMLPAMTPGMPLSFALSGTVYYDAPNRRGGASPFAIQGAVPPEALAGAPVPGAQAPAPDTSGGEMTGGNANAY